MRKRISQQAGAPAAIQPIRGEPQHPAGALPDQQPADGQVRAHANGPHTPAHPPHGLQPSPDLPSQVNNLHLLLS